MSHGYAHQACVMAVELTEEMLRRPPNLLYHSGEQRYCPELSTVSDEIEILHLPTFISYF